MASIGPYWIYFVRHPQLGYICYSCGKLLRSDKVEVHLCTKEDDTEQEIEEVNTGWKG